MRGLCHLKKTVTGGTIGARVGLSWVAGQEAVAEQEAIAGQGRIVGVAEPGQAVKTRGAVGQRLRAEGRAGSGGWHCR